MKRKTTRPTTATRRGPLRTGAPVGDHPEDGEPSPAQEIDLFPAREGRTWAPVEVDRAVRVLAGVLDDGDRSWARWAWMVGDQTLELYNGFPERAKQFRTFRAFMAAAFDLHKDEYFELMRVRARLSSADAAHGLGREKLKLGFRLLDAYEIETFETLEKKELPQLDGETCRWPSATVRQLRAALKLVKLAQKPVPSKRLAGEARRMNEAYALARQEDDDLAAVPVKFFAEDGELLMRNPPLTKAQRLALARFLQRVEE